MKCGHCKLEGTTVAHVRSCSVVMNSPFAVERRTWQENKAIATAKVLDSRPAIVKAATVPAGHYAINYGTEQAPEIKFFKVDAPTEGKWVGYTFVKRVAGDEEWPVRDYGQRSAILQLIGADPLSASKLYGHEIKRCGVCSRRLTRPESRAAGIGPICAAKF